MTRLRGIPQQQQLLDFLVLVLLQGNQLAVEMDNLARTRLRLLTHFQKWPLLGSLNIRGSP